MKEKITGLSREEVKLRIENGQSNISAVPKTKTNKEIVREHSITYFNILNIILAVMILVSSLFNGNFLYGLKNCLFVGVAVTNTIISIIESIYAKNTIEKLNVLAQSKIKVVRDSEIHELNQEELVLNDVCIYELGNQVVTDVTVLSGKVEVNESFITGEAKAITKEKGDEILSGSFIVSGKCYAEVIHVGKDNFISRITSEAKYVKKTNSVIYNSFDKLVKVLSFCLIPIGILLFINQLTISNNNVPGSIMSTVSALIGMIPEGLVLLTSSAMAVSVIRLKRFNVLVQDLYSIENLARVDVIALDKTGTITTGEMEVNKIVPCDGYDMDNINKLLGKYIGSIDDNSLTMQAIKKKVSSIEGQEILDTLPFSSIRKYSGISFEQGNYYLGSPENLLKNVPDNIKEYQQDYRVLVFTKGGKEFKNIDKLTPICYILVHDKIKKNADEVLDYFAKEGIAVKIISGDNATTVASIATKVGIENVKSIDFSEVADEDIPNVVEEYNIFGRVKPDQKKKIVLALQKKGHKVAMTGDGVNDCLALKASDCSIAMASGSDAAKNVSQFVLLDNKVDDLPLILKEGRRSINNIGRSSALLLNKTIFTIILILCCIFMSTEYFFIPVHLTLITMFTISVPSFLLALEKNEELVKGNFLAKALLRAFPCALTVVFNVVIIKLFERQFNLDPALCSTLTVFLTASTGFIFLNSLCRPYNIVRAIMMTVLIVGFIVVSLNMYDFFSIQYFNNNTLLFFIILFICSIFIFDKLQMLSMWIRRKTNNL